VGRQSVGNSTDLEKLPDTGRGLSRLFWMLIEIGVAFLVSLVTSALVALAFTRWYRGDLYSLRVDVADLQERHLRAVRKAASLTRWNAEDDLEEKLEKLLPGEKPKTNRWQKWASKSENSSDGSGPAH
jgi:hypothetical protein